jgi:hypothetical protein
LGNLAVALRGSTAVPKLPVAPPSSQRRLLICECPRSRRRSRSDDRPPRRARFFHGLGLDVRSRRYANTQGIFIRSLSATENPVAVVDVGGNNGQLELPPTRLVAVCCDKGSPQASGPEAGYKRKQTVYERDHRHIPLYVNVPTLVIMVCHAESLGYALFRIVPAFRMSAPDGFFEAQRRCGSGTAPGVSFALFTNDR